MQWNLWRARRHLKAWPINWKESGGWFSLLSSSLSRPVHQGWKKQVWKDKQSAGNDKILTLYTIVCTIWAAWLSKVQKQRREKDLLLMIKVILVSTSLAHSRLIGGWDNFHKQDLNIWQMVITVIRVVITYNWALPRAFESSLANNIYDPPRSTSGFGRQNYPFGDCCLILPDGGVFLRFPFFRWNLWFWLT